MPRLFDLLNGDSDNLGQPKTKKSSRGVTKKKLNLTVKFPRQIHNVNAVEKESEKSVSDLTKLPKIARENSNNNIKKAKKSYQQLVEAAKALLVNVKNKTYEHIKIAQLHKIVDELSNQLITRSSLLEYIGAQGTEGNYLPRHIANVCVLSLATGVQMNFNKSKLYTLGLGAILHDIGMADLESITRNPAELHYDEYEKIKKHVLSGSEIYSKITEEPDALLKEVIQHHHERADGSGYPLGIKGADINEYALIIGLADTYEAATHQRAYRQGRMPHQVMRDIAGPLKSFFGFEAVKAFLNKISIYPIGSFVRLNTGEIAKVISSDSTSPLRPVVLILLDLNLQPKTSPKLLDLSGNNSIYIKEPILLETEKLANKNG